MSTRLQLVGADEHQVLIGGSSEVALLITAPTLSGVEHVVAVYQLDRPTA